MKKQTMTKLGMALSMSFSIGAGGLQADFESPGAGPDLDALTGGDGDRAWNFFLRTFVGYNDNVQLVPDAAFLTSADEGSAYLGLTAQGAYRFMEDGDFSAGMALRVDQTLHFESSGGVAAADNFDLTIVEPALYLNYDGDNWYGRATYSYRWEDADTTLIGLNSHNVSLMVGRELNPCWHAELAWTHGWDDYDTSPGGVAERDGERDRISLSLIRPASESSPRMILRYSYLNNDADGSNFNYDGHELMFRVEAPLSANVGVAAYVSYADLDYSTGGRSEQQLFRAGFQIIYVIDDNWSADFYYHYLDVDSDATFSRAAQNNVGVGFRYDF